MASLIYNSLLEDIATGAVDLNSDTFKAMLVTDSYTADKDAHTKRSDITNEAAGTGYTTGGATVTATVTKYTATDRVDVVFSNPSWAASTITARGLVIYKARGGASSADELVAYVDFGSNIASTSGTFAVTLSSPLRFQN